MLMLQVKEICESGEKYLMCEECYISDACDRKTYLSDYCFTTTVSAIAKGVDGVCRGSVDGVD